MKKLVKTAKQQFEERLKELTLITSHQGVKDERFYLCENDHKEMSILRDSKEWSFFEYKYQGGYQSMIDSEEFLYNMVCRFNEIDEPVKRIFDWYASADKDLTPFTVYDIWQCMEYLTQLAFEDLYEEVPDVRIITAKEQWEDASKNAKVAATIGNGSIYKVEVTEQFISFYVFKGDSYSLSVFPPFSELRKDNKFIIKYLELVRMGHDSDMDLALSWLAGGEYKMSELSLLDIYESAQEISSMDFEDKEVPQEQTIEKKDFSSEMKDLRERMVTHIQDLYKTGFSLNAKEFMENTATIAWIGAGCYDTANLRTCYLRDDEDAVCRFCFETLVADEGDSEDYPLSNFSIETLSKIIASMHY